MNKYDKELEFAKKLALKAGKIITKNFLHSKITTKSNITPVTETDLAVSKLVIDEVKKNFPAHQVLDEELQNTSKNARWLWVCDPVDGTVPFSHHIPTCMFSLALCHNAEPVVAVIYDPFMNGEKIHVKVGNFEKGDWIFGISYWNKNFDTNKYIDLTLAKKIRVTYIESIVYQSMLVATGITKGLVIIPASPWNRAAAKMIVENAGGRCTNEKGERLTVFGKHNYFIASNGTVHGELLEIVNKCKR